MDNFTDIKHSVKDLLKLCFSNPHLCSTNQKHQGQNNIPKKLLTNIHPHCPITTTLAVMANYQTLFL